MSFVRLYKYEQKDNNNKVTTIERGIIVYVHASVVYIYIIYIYIICIIYAQGCVFSSLEFVYFLFFSFNAYNVNGIVNPALKY